MNRIKLNFSVLFFSLIFFYITAISNVSAQKYNTAIGVRFGSTWGMTIQQRIAKKTTIELIGSRALFDDYTQINLLGEQHLNILTKRLNLYVGLGPYLSFWDDENEKRRTGFGFGLVTGLELTLGRLNIAYDVQPTIGITEDINPFRIETALSLRYMIFERKWEPFKKWKKKRKKKKRKKKRKERWGF